jgi:hypothetical protein
MAAFQDQVGDDADQVRVAAAFADAVDGALDLRGPLGHGGQGIGHGHVAIVVAVNSYLDAQGLASLTRASGDLLRQRAAIGIAQDDYRGSCLLGGL